MKQSGEYAGVVLNGIDPVKIADGFGVEGMHVQDESGVEDAIAHGLKVVEGEKRPFLLNVHLPLGLPEGGSAAEQFRLADYTGRFLNPATSAWRCRRCRRTRFCGATEGDDDRLR